MAEFAVFALFVLVGVGGTLALWACIEGETEEQPRMSRADAERAARRDTDDGDDRR